MEIKKTLLKRCVLMEVSGKIDSNTAPQLSEQIKTVTDEGNYRLVLDLSNLEFISSAGLWVLNNTRKTCKRYNRGELVLSGVSPKIRSALDLAGFLPYYPIYKDAAEAVGSF